MIIAGLGFTSAATPNDLIAAVHTALQQQGLRMEELAGLASIEGKQNSAALQNAASTLGVGVEIIAPARLDIMSPRVITRSEKSLAATGVPSVSEAAALGAARAQSKLLASRIICGPVTCALVRMIDELKSET